MIKNASAKKHTALTLCLLLMLSLLVPAAALAAEPPSSSYTICNGTMAFGYEFSSTNFDIKGYYGNSWKSTTYSDYGYYTYLKVNKPNQETETHAVTASASGKTYDGLNIKITAVPQELETTFQIVYIIKNENSDSRTFALGSGADIQIGSDDSADISIIGNRNGMKMVSAKEGDLYEGYYPQFSFFGSDYHGVTDVTDFWYGPYSSSRSDYHWSSNRENAVFYTSDLNYVSDSPYDSAMSWHWSDQTLAPGEEKTYSVLITIGRSGSDNDVPGTSLNSPNGSVILELDNPPSGQDDFIITVDGQQLEPGTDFTVRNPESTQPIIQFTDHANIITCDTENIDVTIDSTGETTIIPINLPHTDENGHGQPVRPVEPTPTPTPTPTSTPTPTPIPEPEATPEPTITPVPTAPKLPKTGDSTPLCLLYALALCSSCALFMAGRKRAAKKNP